MSIPLINYRNVVTHFLVRVRHHDLDFSNEERTIEAVAILQSSVVFLSCYRIPYLYTLQPGSHLANFSNVRIRRAQFLRSGLSHTLTQTLYSRQLCCRTRDCSPCRTRTARSRTAVCPTPAVRRSPQITVFPNRMTNILKQGIAMHRCPHSPLP